MVAGYSVAAERAATPTELISIDAATGNEQRVVILDGDHLIQGISWINRTRLLLEKAEGARVGLWSADISNLTVWTPVTREFRWVLNVNLTQNRQVAVATYGELRTGIWTSDLRGNDTVLVPESASAALDPIVDQSGSILYSAESGNGRAIYRLAAGATIPKLVATGASGSFAASTDGQIIVFSGSAPAYPLLQVNPDGSGLKTLVARDATAVGLSPDGKTVLFTPVGLGLYSLPIAGGRPRKLSDRALQVPMVSPDGRRVLAATDKPQTLLVCDLPDCTNPTDVRINGTSNTARWSLNGHGIASVNPTEHRNIWVQPLDPAPAYPVTHYEDARIRAFSWAPDGARLVTSRGQFVNDVVLITGLR
jgi:dipeptidyl aminopeptidase/acylaminoacyl peptidase